MKFKKYNHKGLTLIEVVLGIALLSIVLMTFAMGFSNIFTNIHKGKDITVETFSIQESMERQISSFSKDDLEETSPTINVFGKNVPYKKIISSDSHGKRNFVAYVSEPSLGVLPTPEIKDVQLKAYNTDDNEIFPWYEEGTKLVASYDVSDENVFQKNYAWYSSKERDGQPIKNPNFNIDYDIFKSDNGIYKGHMPSGAKIVNYNNLTNKRYYHYSITPYSEFGRLGRMAINPRRLLVIERTDNEYWNNLIENTYLEKVNLNLSPQIFTMNNIEEPTLNIESNSSTKENGPLLFYPLHEDYQMNTDSFKIIVETQFTEKALEEEAGFGVFLGEYKNGKENGIIYLLDKTNNSIKVKEISNGNINGTIKSFEIPENFDWSKRYKWSFDIFRGGEKNIKVSYKDINSSNFTELEGDQIIDRIDLKFSTNHIGLKTWSDYDFEDEFTEEHRYMHNLTVDFYDISFEKIILHNDILFIFGGDLNISADNISGENKSIYFDFDLNKDTVKNNGHIRVSNIYVKENLELLSGSHQLGSKEKPGEIHVNGSFIERGSRNIYGDLFIGGDFISENSSSSIYGDLHVSGKLKLESGQVNIYSNNVFVNGGLILKDAIIYGDVFVNGDVELYWKPVIKDDAKIYYTGQLSYPSNYPEEILKKLIKKSDVPRAKEPNVPSISYPKLREEEWYLNNGYVSGGELKDNIKIYTNSYTQSTWSKSVENIIIVAKEGDIRIENFGGSTIKGILFAPNGKVYLNGKSFKGLIIAKNGIDYVQGGGSVVIKNIDEIINNPKDYPFK